MKGLSNNSRLNGLLVLAIAAAALWTSDANSQSSDQGQAAFDVASIRPTTNSEDGGEGSSRSKIEYTADSLTLRNISLTEMVEWAYDSKAYQVISPRKLDSQRYDVSARANDQVALGTLRQMLRELLTSRFKVELHRESRSISVFELVVAPGGPILSRSKDEGLASTRATESLPRVIDGGFMFINVTMNDFASQLSELRGIDRPVVNRTGIQGTYDINLKSAANAILQPDGPSLLTLIHEQLGLKLVPAKDPINVIVVDRAERPSDN